MQYEMQYGRGGQIILIKRTYQMDVRKYYKDIVMPPRIDKYISGTHMNILYVNLQYDKDWI